MSEVAICSQGSWMKDSDLDDWKPFIQEVSSTPPELEWCSPKALKSRSKAIQYKWRVNSKWMERAQRPPDFQRRIDAEKCKGRLFTSLHWLDWKAKSKDGNALQQANQGQVRTVRTFIYGCTECGRLTKTQFEDVWSFKQHFLGCI